MMVKCLIRKTLKNQNEIIFMLKLLRDRIMTKKKTAKVKRCPETKFSKAEEISRQYGYLSGCCSVISSLSVENDNPYGY